VPRHWITGREKVKHSTASNGIFEVAGAGPCAGPSRTGTANKTASGGKLTQTGLNHNVLSCKYLQSINSDRAPAARLTTWGSGKRRYLVRRVFSRREGANRPPPIQISAQLGAEVDRHSDDLPKHSASFSSRWELLARQKSRIGSLFLSRLKKIAHSTPSANASCGERCSRLSLSISKLSARSRCCIYP
jgi:hypothetical protein